MGKVRPAGKIRPVEALNKALGVVFSTQFFYISCCNDILRCCLFKSVVLCSYFYKDPRLRPNAIDGVILISYSFTFQWLCVINCAVLYNLIFVIGRAGVNFINILRAAFAPVDLRPTYWRKAQSVKRRSSAQKYHKSGVPTGVIYAQKLLVKQKLSSREYARVKAAHVDEIVEIDETC